MQINLIKLSKTQTETDNSSQCSLRFRESYPVYAVVCVKASVGMSCESLEITLMGVCGGRLFYIIKSIVGEHRYKKTLYIVILLMNVILCLTVLSMTWCSKEKANFWTNCRLVERRQVSTTSTTAVYLRSRSFKVINFCCNQKPIYDFLLVIVT